jgi:cell wall-associated NlpC family hydrolase
VGKALGAVVAAIVVGIVAFVALIPAAVTACEGQSVAVNTGDALTIYDGLDVLTEDQAAALAESVGLPGRAFGQLARGESTLRVNAVGHDPGGTLGLGLWQITTGFNDDIIARYGGREAMFIPSVNAMAAKAIYDRQGIGAWYGTGYLTDPQAHFTGPIPPATEGGPGGRPNTQNVSTGGRAGGGDDDGVSHIAWPTAVKTIVSGFGPRSSPGGIGSTNHMGVDIGAPAGAEVRAVADGTISHRGVMGGYGNYVCVRHSTLMTTCYAHLSAYGAYQMNMRVSAGGVIGRVGSTGNSTGPHLHFEVRLGGSPSAPPTDPQPYLSGAGDAADPVGATDGCGGAQGAPVETVVVGDSLAVGMRDALGDELDGWQLSFDAQTGRDLAQGEKLLPDPAAGDRVVALSLGSNDGATGTRALREVNEKALRAAGPGGCVVWATIHVAGAPVGELNDEIRARARADTRVRVVDWAAHVRDHPGHLAGDGTHATGAGYAARARLYADVIRECAPAPPAGAPNGVSDERLADDPGPVAVVRDGRAAAPASAPEAVKRMIAAGNGIQSLPYTYGGGHDPGFTPSPGLDCSSTVSWVLHRAGVLKAPMASGQFARWGRPGRGKWVTVYSNAGHAFVVIAGQRLDTSPAGSQLNDERGPRWRGSRPRSTAGFVATHPPGL